MSAWRKGLVLLATLAFAGAGQTAAAHAETEGPSWQFAPAIAPPPPTGAQPAPFPTNEVALGTVGDIKFWAPNRGLLITGGTSLVPAGLYAYDGQTWHELSNVCGGAGGRIAWAGPEEFWTISDQRPGQVTATGVSYSNVSLCHFKEGQVVGSYALPLDQPNSYLPMDSAACLSPEDCWFGGEIAQPPNPNTGAFHLHWDGQNVTVVYAPEDHAVAAMALVSTPLGNGNFQPSLFESVQLAPGDEYGLQSTTHPPLLHLISAGSGTVFHDIFPPNPGCEVSAAICYPLPEYGFEERGAEQLPVDPQTLAGFSLSSDYSPALGAASGSQLWAVAGPDATAPMDSSHGDAHPIALRYESASNAWTQVAPNLGGFPSGSDPLGVAAEPDAPAAWVTLASHDRAAHVDRLTSAGTLTEADTLGPAQGVGYRGEAGPIACPAPQECWLATNQGWLFHLTSRNAQGPLPQDTDPNFAGIIAFRPPDGGTLLLPSDTPPPDDSLANQAPPVLPPAQAQVQGVSVTHEALVQHMRTKLLKQDTLSLTFTLTVSAHVQLLASRHSHLIADTRRTTLHRGHHELRLRLNPRRWPTKLDLRASPLEPLPTVAAPPSGSGSTPTLTAPISSNSLTT
jgi:hypothetical protein